MLEEKKETEFAYTFGHLTGLISSPDIQEHLKAHNISQSDIELLEALMKNIAFKVFLYENV